jgi:hypothetical protein
MGEKRRKEKEEHRDGRERRDGRVNIHHKIRTLIPITGYLVPLPHPTNRHNA